MNALVISQPVLDKLKAKHGVARREIEQCFDNREGGFLMDEREDHRTDPPTLWFIAPTNGNRLLKVVFIAIDGRVHIKTAYAPNDTEIGIYERHGK
ncbi:MAG: hypothetical protein KGZ83_17160 [Sulfuricella sp.]|nr:hypothetical protein [Sulfuricella sp.]